MADLPFTLFQTYRENFDGKYWFPYYSRSDGTLNLKGLEIPFFFLMMRRPPRSTLFPYTDALPISARRTASCCASARTPRCSRRRSCGSASRSEEHTSELQSQFHLVCRLLLEKKKKKSVTRCKFKKKNKK